MAKRRASSSSPRRALTSWLCFVCGRAIGGVRVGLWAATLEAIEPGQWAWSAMLVTEPLCTAFVIASVAAALRYLATERWRWLAVATIAAAAAAYERFVAYLMPAALLLAIVWIAAPHASVARRALRDDYPPVYRYRTFWLSPVVDDAWRAAARLFAPPMPLDAMATRPVPRGMWLLAGALMLGSLLFAAWRVRGTTLSPAARVAWIVACGALSLPAAIALWLVYPRERHDIGFAGMREAAA